MISKYSRYYQKKKYMIIEEQEALQGTAGNLTYLIFKKVTFLEYSL